MKIRQGFVSNSSSSSFVVAAKEVEGKANLKIYIEIDLSNYVERTISTEEQLAIYAKSNNVSNSFFKECLQSLQNGKKIYIGSVCDEEDDLKQEFLRANGIPIEFIDDPEVVVISNC